MDIAHNLPPHTSVEPMRATIRLQVEMTRVAEVELELPEGVSIDDLALKRLYRWPDGVVEAIIREVGEQLNGEPLSRLADNITEVYSDDLSLDIAATW